MPESTNPIDKISAAVDRFQESHFWIHALENFYHYADPFRWHLNAFLKALKEIPQLLQMELQNEPGFPDWFREKNEKFRADLLVKYLAEKRDFVVHRGMLVPNSEAMIGITEGRGVKLGLTLPISPRDDSDDGMSNYLWHVAQARDTLGILVPDDDSLPCVHRIWRLPRFEDEIVDVAARAWLRTGEVMNAVAEWLGEASQPLALDCRHTSQQVQFKLYSREKLREELATLRSELKGK